MYAKPYHNNAVLYGLTENGITIFYDGWDDFTPEENFSGLVETVENAINRSLTQDEKKELKEVFKIPLELCSCPV